MTQDPRVLPLYDLGGEDVLPSGEMPQGGSDSARPETVGELGDVLGLQCRMQ